MVKIILDDEDLLEPQLDESGNPIENHGDTFNNEQLEIKPVYLSERRKAQFLAEYDCVVVNEYGDEYHLSEEERIEKNKFYEAFKIFSKCKHKYGKLDQYVSATREALKCLDFVAENNGVYPPDKFKKKFFNGSIKINGLTFPKYKGRDRKTISYEYLSEFILSDADPKEILPKNNIRPVYDEDDLKELRKRLFTEEEFSRITAPPTEEEKIEMALPFDKYDDKQKDCDVAVFMSKKEAKQVMKECPEILTSIKEMRRSNKSLETLSRFAYDMVSDDIEAIAQYDKEHNYKSLSDMPEFHGDIMNSDDYYKYLSELDEYQRTQIKDNYKGKLKTEEQVDEIELRILLESNGWNVRNLYGNKEREKRLRKIDKKDKERQKEIKKKLIAVQNRRKRRMGEEVDDIPEEKTKKKKGKKKKKVKENNSPKKKYIDQQEKNMDEFLLGVSSSMSGDMKDYKKETLDWSWDSIMEGK